MAKKKNNSKGNFSIISNTVINDGRLSFKAKGLYVYMWSKSDDWHFTEASLADHSEKDGRASVRSGLKELISFGYLYRRQEKSSENNRFTTETVYELYENPVDNPYFEEGDFDIEADEDDAENVLEIPDVRKSNNGVITPDMRFSDVVKPNDNIIIPLMRDKLLLREEVTRIVDYYIEYHFTSYDQILLLKQKEIIITRIVDNVDGSIKNLNSYISITLINEIKHLYQYNELNSQAKNRYGTTLEEINAKTYPDAEKEIAFGIDWEQDLEDELE